MSTEPANDLRLQLALYRLKLARLRAERAIIIATLAMQAQRRVQQQQVIDKRLSEMMTQHDRLDA